MGRLRGGSATKIHALTNQDGLPIRYGLTPGQTHNAPPCEQLLDSLQPGQYVLANKAYDADWIREMIWQQGALDVIASKANRKLSATFDAETPAVFRQYPEKAPRRSVNVKNGDRQPRRYWPSRKNRERVRN